MALIENIFDSAEQLNQGFCEKICSSLAQGIEANGRASLVVSGGNTPKPLFAKLGHVDMAWDKVDITLADERWVDNQDAASNEKMVREHLLVGYAAKANFVPLKTAHADVNEGIAEAEAKLASMAQPFDVLILGMGEDGHTASIFPCSEQVDRGLDLDSGLTLLATQPTTAPNQRISLSLPALLNSRKTFLHLTGDKKRQVLAQAATLSEQPTKHKLMPISAVIHHTDVELMWAP